MNHTSEYHELAKKARQGDGEYMSRYFFYNNREIPDEYEKTVPQVFPTTAPGNFYLASGYRSLCHDYLLSVPVGSELRQSPCFQ